MAIEYRPSSSDPAIGACPGPGVHLRPMGFGNEGPKVRDSQVVLAGLITYFASLHPYVTSRGRSRIVVASYMIPNSATTASTISV